jgi:hypothetical protein
MRTTQSPENNSSSVLSDVNRKKNMAQCAEFEPMLMACFALQAALPPLAKAFIRGFPCHMLGRVGTKFCLRTGL